MKLVGIEWDDDKNELNQQLHDLAFEDAQYVFADPERLERFDRSEGYTSREERWQTLAWLVRFFSRSIRSAERTNV